MQTGKFGGVCSALNKRPDLVLYVSSKTNRGWCCSLRGIQTNLCQPVVVGFHLTLLLHRSPGVSHRLPGAGDVQKHRVRHARHAEPLLAHILISDGDQVIHAVLLELLGHLLRPLLVELHRVQVTRGGDGSQDGVGERAAACT